MSLSCFSRKFIITVLKFKIILTIRLDRLYFLTRQSSQTFLLYFLPTSRRRDDDDAHKKISADEFADEPKLLLTSLFRSDTFCSFLWICKEKSSMSFWTLSHSCDLGSWIWLGDRPVMSSSNAGEKIKENPYFLGVFSCIRRRIADGDADDSKFWVSERLFWSSTCCGISGMYFEFLL